MGIDDGLYMPTKAQQEDWTKHNSFMDNFKEVIIYGKVYNLNFHVCFVEWEFFHKFLLLDKYDVNQWWRNIELQLEIDS